MHNNFYLLRQISSRLQKKLAGFTLVSCFSQNREEIVIEFNDSSSSFFIRADLRSDFSCLTFPTTFNRARKNSIDLFNEVLMKKVIGIHQFDNERAFVIHLEDKYSVLFKMHGNMSNVLLVQNNQVIDLFKNALPQDRDIDITQLDRRIDFSKENFLQNFAQPEKIYFTFGKPVWNFLDQIGFDSADREKKWQLLSEVRSALEKPNYFIVHDSKIFLSLLPFERRTNEFNDPLLALNAFHSEYTSTNAFIREKSKVISRLSNEINSTKSWLDKTGDKLAHLRTDQHYKQWGDLVMANLHAIKPETTEVELDDFYDAGKKVVIKLDPQLSAQKNAERFYRKGKNQQIEVTKLTEGFNSRQSELEKLTNDLKTAEGTSDFKILRDLGARWMNSGEAAQVSLPYHETEFKGYRIWIGKDAKRNDELTLKYSYKEDLWLHVKDDTGSHVLIKHQAGKPFPKDVIERAASIAAFFSKRKTESLCAVVFTPKKFVRKKKGEPAGKVVVEREEVVLVEPKGLLVSSF